MNNLSDKIITVFLDKQILTLKDSDISLSLVAQGIQCYTEEVRRHVQSLSPALFQLSFNKDSAMTIHVDPIIDICGVFLVGRCHNTVKPCGKLHLCREFDHCTIPKCRYPHDFTRGENRKIVEQMNCQDVNSQLIVKLIRLKTSLEKNLNRSESFAHTPNSSHFNQQLSRKIDIDRQVDISFPSLNHAPQIDMEIIAMTLNVENFKIEQTLNESENEYFRRVTIQLEQMNNIDKLLSSLIPFFNTNDIKFKRTKQIVDRTSFVLKTLINNKQDKIAEGRVKLYIALLIGNDVLFTIIDLSTTEEQFFLVQCNRDIEFDKVYQQYQSKAQLQGKDLSLIQIYECDTVIIRYIDENKIMKYDDIENIIRSTRKNVFTYQLTADNCVEVEFINADAFKQWMSTVEKTMAKFHIIVTHVVNNMDDKDDSDSIINSAQSIPFNINSPSMNKFQRTTIKLRSEWAMVASHPVFMVEYKDYIRNELGGEIDIDDDEISYTGNFPQLPRSPTNESILTNKTNNYMQKFKYQTFHDLKSYHVGILRAHSATVAFSRVRRNDYMVAAKAHDMFELKSKLFPKTNQCHQPGPIHPLINHQSINRSPPMPLLNPETIERSTSLSTASAATTNFIYPVVTPEQMSMFSINTFEDRLQQHLKETFNVKTDIERNTINDKSKREKSRIIIRITGPTNDAEGALNDLMSLFLSLRVRKFDDKTDGNWTKIEEATQVIQHHFKLTDLTCTCQKTSPTSVCVNYFDISNPQFGVDEQKIEDIISNLFSSATITYNPQSTSSKFTKDWMDLEETIRKRDDYKKDICLSNEINAIYLFGLTKLVKEFRQAFEQLKNKHVPQSCKITLSEKQLNYLIHVGKDDLNKLDKHYKVDGCDLSLTRLRRDGDFLAPLDMHSKIKDNLQALVQIDETTFEIKSSAFEVLISTEPERLFSLVKSKCYLEKKVRTRRINIPVPTAQVADLEDLAKQSQHANVTNTTRINVAHSTITIAIGDLTTQAVDVIVVCSTSDIMRKSILAKAGSQVQTEYDALNSNVQQASATSSGALPCKTILFLPCKVHQSHPSSLKRSLSTFISTAITHAISNGLQTLAFPSVGCGQLGFDPSIVAQHMIDETQIELIKTHSKLDVSFILLPAQQNVYDEFVKYLGNITTPRTTIPKLHSISKTNHQLKIPYDEKTIQITLISSNDNHLLKCKQAILEFSRLSSFTKRLTNKDDMIDWSQNTINQYYDYCLKQHVIPTLDFDTHSLELVGPKDAVDEAEKYFYELTTETFKQARNHAVSRGVIWSVEVTPGSDTWEQYSFKHNGIIEDAHLKQLPHLDFVNDKQEKCRIVFASMEEQHGSDVRSIRRKVVDSLLPDTWEGSDQNCKRVTLQSSSKEYQTVLKQFDATMKNQYTQILKIERIQNERWYKQYAAHRDDYKRRSKQLDERLLFHGCLGAAANQIIQECFNRSFAGVNGVAFGYGVYFHSHASYSHTYAKPSGSGERTMFLARVLIGKTCRGDPSMKVVPSGYDTTTDGQNIFVIYHDAGAYADHLITYK